MSPPLECQQPQGGELVWFLFASPESNISPGTAEWITDPQSIHYLEELYTETGIYLSGLTLKALTHTDPYWPSNFTPSIPNKKKQCLACFMLVYSPL